MAAMTRNTLRLAFLGSLAASAGLLSSAPAAADPVLRHQADSRGDVVVFGSTLTYDCGSSVSPPAGTTPDCSSDLALEQADPATEYASDTSGDMYWRDNVAAPYIDADYARTSATLALPAGSQITYARLYWSALKVGPDPDTSVTLDWDGGPVQEITADADGCQPTIQFPFATHPDWYYYQCSGDATSYVANWGAGDFRVTGVSAIPLTATMVNVAYSAWTLVVFYENPNDDLRNLALFDGFEIVDPENNPPSVQANLSGFLVPPGFDAKMMVFMYEGDMGQPGAESGDSLTMNGTAVSNASNPVDDFFNSSRTFMGTPYSGSFDVPRFSGEPDSMAGYDLDTVNVTSSINAGDTSAVVGAEASVDKFILGGFVTSITNKAPDFNNLTKDVVDLNGGAVLPGDILEYTITAQNTGNDDAVNVSVEDTIKAGLDFLPGSIQLVAGGPTGTKTDQAGDDQGEYIAASRKIVVRVGSGANASSGGSVAVGESISIKFRVTVTATQGTIENTAILSAGGASGQPTKTYESDSDPNAVGRQPTVVVIDECSSDAQCSGLKPHCDLDTHVCMGCTTDADCSDPANPACQPNGSCGECSATNDNLCTGDTAVCNVATGICVLCTPGSGGDASMCVNSPDGPVCIAGANNAVFCGCATDSDCGSTTSGRVCDTSVQKCIDGCRGQGGNGCPAAKECTSKDTTIGECFVPQDDGDAGIGGSAGTGPDSNAGADPQQSGDDGGCACATGTHRTWGDAVFAGLAALGAVALLRRSRKS